MSRKMILVVLVGGAICAVWQLLPNSSPSPAAEPEKTPPPSPSPDPLPLSDEPLPIGYRVRVVKNGLPIAKASVVLYPPDPRTDYRGRPIPTATATTRADGWASLRVSDPPVPDASSQLQIDAAYSLRTKVPFVNGATVALEDLPVVRGRVSLPDGSPASAARVANQDLIHQVQTLTGPDGRFELRVPWLSEDLVAHQGSASGLFGGFESGTRVPTEITIALKEDPTAQGMVVDRSGKPLPGVAVEVRHGQLERHFLTAPDGKWEGSLFPWSRNQLTYSKEGFVSLTQMSGDGTAAVVLSRPGKILGTVVAHNGVSVPHAWVNCSGMREGLSAGADGSFVLEGISEPSVVLTASTDDEARTTLRVEVPEAQTVIVRLVMPPALIQVPLEVVNVRGEQDFDWEAVARPIPPTGWESHSSEGTVGLSQGRFRIFVRAEEADLSGEVTMDVSPVVDAQPIRIVLYGSDGGRGKLRDTDRAAVSTAKVRVVTATGQPAWSAVVECNHGRARSLGNGNFECPFYGDEEGAIEVKATLGERTAVASLVPHQTGVKLVLQAQWSISGKVIGVLPPSAYVSLESASQSEEEIPLTSNEFEFSCPPVRTVLCVIDPTAQKRLGCAIVQSEDRVEIPIGDPGTTTFTVVDQQGRPVENPTLYVDRIRESGVAPNGAVSLVLSPGSHLMVINVPGSNARVETIFTVRSHQLTALGTLKMQ
jgi:hypothetical protein